MLTDNISLLQQLDSFGGPLPPVFPGTLRPRLREVSIPPTWMYCFFAYIALQSPDVHTQQMLAYARLIIREAQRHGGRSWLDYNHIFRQQAGLDRSLPWNCVHPSIQASTLLSRPSGSSAFCSLCREPDHTADSCALTYLDPNQGHPHSPRLALSTAQPAVKPRISLQRHTICNSWNRGACIFPSSCIFQHICATCHQHHRARDCARTPPNSVFKRSPLPGKNRC